MKQFVKGFIYGLTVSFLFLFDILKDIKEIYYDSDWDLYDTGSCIGFFIFMITVYFMLIFAFILLIIKL